MKFVIANFKQNFNLDELSSWIDTFTSHFESNADCQVIIAGNYIHLPHLNERHLNFSVAAQTVSPFVGGAHTGQVGAPQLKGLVDYCLVGHSETRKELGDTDLEVAKESKLLQSSGITPIIFLDTPYLESQIDTLKKELLSLQKLIFVYEPAAAIGTGNSDNPEHANQMAFKIKSLTNKSFPVLYGGSVNSENVHGFTAQEYIDGVVPGKASLDPKEFINIISNV